jgi:hypothetical protein
MIITESLTFGSQILTMGFFRKYSILILALAIISGCRHKKHSLSGEEPVEVGDFIEFFPPKNLPYSFSDTILQKKEKDSLLISYKVFTQFIPDSLLVRVFGKNVRPKIYPMGKIEVPKAETYLFVKTISGDKRAAFILSFDKKQNFIAAMPALRLDQSVSTTQSFIMDSRYTFSKTLLRKNPDGSTSEGKDVYVLNEDAKNFMLIMTDALEDKPSEIINPIDTVSRKNKLSADYTAGKMNLVSIRDGRRNDRISFFIHFEKNNGECTGELKGDAILLNANTAEYRQNGDPCVLRFNFVSSSLSLKEVEACGSHRGLRCSFDGNFMRKKEIKQAATKKKPGKK